MFGIELSSPADLKNPALVATEEVLSAKYKYYEDREALQESGD